jgi:ADP-heptose:LPS heptosyltransferase
MVGRVETLSPQRVVLLRALVLGDMLCAVPALRALRMALPKAHIVLVGLPWAREFATRFSRYLSGFLEFPGYPGLTERLPNIGQIPGFLQTAQQARFDLAIQMHGNGLITNPLAALFGARQNAGFFPPGQPCPDPAWFLPYPEHESEVGRLLRLMEFLGVPACDQSLEFPLQEADYQTLQAIPQVRRLQPGCYVCVHPGASVASRRWHVEGFAAVADALAQQDVKVVLTGSLGEADLADAISRQMHRPALNLAGRTSLGALAALLNGARMVVCNDTGVSHLAAALRVPSVVLVLSSDPVRWAPSDHNRHRVLFHEVPCRPCAQAVCPVDFPCCRGIAVEQVIQTAMTVLAKYSEERLATVKQNAS